MSFNKKAPHPTSPPPLRVKIPKNYEHENIKNKEL
jgi:hypothetical protein